MKKTLTVLLVTLFLLLSFGFSVWAEDEQTTLGASDPVRYNFSIGVDHLPWSANSFSLRWWKNESDGREFTVRFVGMEFTKDIDFYDESGGNRYFISGLRYDWLHREKIDLWDNLFYTWGNGIGVSFDTEITDTTNTTEGILYYFHPLGIEHFFWDKYPNLSYSIQADFYFGLQYRNTSATDSEYSMTSTNLSLGVSPSFYLRYYIK